jgi:Ca2+-binding RTX toxin-like protein
VDGPDTLGGEGVHRFRFKGRCGPGLLTGNDSLVGGAGDDWITGGDESATLHDQNNGADTLTGGPGNDVLDTRSWSTGSTNPADLITDREAGDVVPMEDYTRPATPAEVSLGEDAYAVHRHAVLYLSINDNGTQRDVAIPGGAGDFVDPNVNNTGPRFHIHADRPSVLHMHDLDAGTFTLGEFFRNWGVTIGANHIGRYVAGNGHTFGVVVRHADGQSEALTDPYNYVIKGALDPAAGDQITVIYT